MDYLFFLRPIILIPVWTFFLLGFYHGWLKTQGKVVPFTGFLQWYQEYLPELTRFFFSERVWYVWLAYTLLMGAIYIINQIYDRESDLINDKLFFIPKGLISLKQARLETVLLVLICTVLMLSSSFPLVLLFVVSFFMGVLYSVPPFKFKGRPFWDLLFNALGYGFVAFLVGWLTVAPYSHKVFWFSLPYVLAVGATFVNTTIPDNCGDQNNGDVTTGLFLGMRNAALLSTGLLGLAIIFSVIQNNPICLVAAVISLPFFVRALIKKDKRTFLISSQASGRVFVFLVSLLFPIYLIFLGVVFLATRWYYRARFDVIYPVIGR
ncbi:UbiA family prenyltransferase [candidate division KSB1 bacterium]|nr:UbiA family prenyltransferase [candidate division KSB1 bacterium]